MAVFQGMHVLHAIHNDTVIYKKSVTTKLVWLPDGHTDMQTRDKAIPMCCYTSQVTQKHGFLCWFYTTSAYQPITFMFL